MTTSPTTQKFNKFFMDYGYTYILRRAPYMASLFRYIIPYAQWYANPRNVKCSWSHISKTKHILDIHLNRCFAYNKVRIIIDDSTHTIKKEPLIWNLILP